MPLNILENEGNALVKEQWLMKNSSNFHAKSLQEKYVRIFKGNFVADEIKSYARNLLKLKTILKEIHQPSLSYISLYS